MNEQEVENAIVAAGKTAPRITPADLDDAIVEAAYYRFPGTMLIVCALTLRNGFTVTGESACASPENFDPEIGQQIARRNAREKMWPLLGYALKERLCEQTAVKSLG